MSFETGIDTSLITKEVQPVASQDNDRLKRRFTEHSLYKTVLTSQIRAEAKAIQKSPADDLAVYDLDSRIAQMCERLPLQYKDIGTAVARDILGTERDVQGWLGEHTHTNSARIRYSVHEN